MKGISRSIVVSLACALPALASLACGGTSGGSSTTSLAGSEREHEPSTGGATSAVGETSPAGASGGGAPTSNAAGTVGTGGDGNASLGGNGECGELTRDDRCSDCDAVDSSLPECVDGAWQCPPPFVALRDCPSEECRASKRCCNHETGDFERVWCDDEGQPGQCADGYDEIPEGACMPAGVEVSSCGELSDQACEAEGLSCYDGQRCSTECHCAVGEDGALRWQCLTLLC